MFILGLIFVACLPLYLIRFSIFGFPTTVLEILLLVWLAFWLKENYQGILTRLKQNFKKGQIKNPYPFSWEIILLILISFSAVITAHFSMSALGLWRAYFIEPVIAFVLFFNTFNSKEKIYKAISVLSFTTIILGLVAAYQYLTGQFIPNEFWAQVSERRATSIFPYPNALGLYMAPLACLFAGSFVSSLRENRRRAILYGVGFFVALISIALARSEGALIAVAAALFIMLFLSNLKARLVAFGLAIVIILAVIFSLPLRNYSLEKLSLSDFSGQIRRFQWRETLIMLNDNRILTGAGLAQYQKTIVPYHQKGFFFNKEKMPNEEFVKKIKDDKAFRDSHWQPLEIYLYPHNIFLNFWSELGLLGALLFVWIILRFLWQSIKNYFVLLKQKDTLAFISLGLFGAMLAIVIQGLVDVPYLKNDLAMMFWLFISFLGFICVKSYKKL